MKTFLGWLLALGLAASATAQDTGSAPDLEMWRLGCGELEISDMAAFSDAHLYDGEPRTLTVSCYLIRNGDQYLLWDAGLDKALVGASFTQSGATLSMEQSIEKQLESIGISPSDVTYAGVSHFHFDHVMQLPDFAQSTLLIGAKDWEMIKAATGPDPLLDPRPFAPWLGDDTGQVTAIAKDHDVFGDGSVVMKATPGHTPGHTVLLVRMPQMGNVLLTGDLYHFEEQVTNRGVPEFNTDRADTLASFERFNATAKTLNATVIIGHDPRHLDRLPPFPESAR
ncbi:N-acyl homoserine lactonase family protein [uncultured Erythrobacter sp.]|uniref:N-acyl homoserine lactonase family protein n=1 Tax=uncultured Erythrobacter sp. TaxID=263913 RepID=UPI00262FF87E|nr:N-acyl homoserine lactonase family protein [uncultured Erythrobacter sp.]